MAVNPHLETIEAWTTAGLRSTVPMAELHEAFPEAYRQVAAAVAQAGAQLVGPAYGCYFGMPDDLVDVEIGFGIDREVDLPGLVVTTHQPQRAVVATHVGPYSELSRSYDELMPWLAGQNLELADRMWELYDSEPDAEPAETVTRIVFPLQDGS